MKKKILASSFFIIFGTIYSSAQKYTDNLIKAAYIYKFANYIEWKNEKNFTKFKIGIFANDTSLHKEFEDLAASKQLKGQTIELVKFNDIESIRDIQIFYAPEDKAEDVDNILTSIKGKNILLISDNCKSQKSVMINFTYSNDKKKNISFEVNKKNINENNLTVLPKLLLLGGSEIDVRKLYDQSQDSLRNEKVKVEKQKEELEKQKQELEKQSLEIQNQKNQIVQQKAAIDEQQKRIDQQKSELGNLNSQVKIQQDALTKKLEELKIQEQNIKKQESRIAEQKNLIEQHSKILKDQTDQIDIQQKRIEKQKSTLTQQTSTIKTQKNTIYFIFLILLIALFFGFYIYRNYKIKQRINQELEEKNDAIIRQNTEIHNQKEEIQAASELISATNKELEKLSIVASETDNAVIIMDNTGNFEWINDGFTRLYGYTLAEFTKKFGDNIIKASSNPNIREVIESCINEKHSKTYESTALSKTNEKFWVQTTVTPIFGDMGNITKLIAIDSDITEMKAAEAEIKQKSEEISAQNELLEVRNWEIMNQSEILKDINERINSGIRYALTIQNAILPPKELIDKSFENFILFKPKDVVSGDFYWYIHVPFENTDYYFAAAVDCTGHGVPGAFMSMIGSRLLNEAVLEKMIYQPNQILEEINKNLIIQLKQDTKINNDGMDLCLVRIEKNRTEKNYKIIFCGAKRPLFVYKNSESEILEIKPNRRSIGGSLHRNLSPFANEEISINADDVIYLSTDGYIDQNNVDRKKFSTLKFTSMLKSSANLSLSEQHAILENELTNHMFGTEQRDDITVMGFKMPRM